MNIKELAKSIRRTASQLDPEAAEMDATEFEAADRRHLDLSQKEIWLISVNREEVGSVAGQVVSAHPMIAARWLKESTHVLASPEQVAAHKAELGRRKEEIEKAESDRKGVPTSKLLEALTATLAASTSGRRSEKER